MTEMPLFDISWEKAKIRIFRLESLPVYNVPGDMKIFEEWKKSKKFPAGSYEEWIQKLEKTKQRGVVMQRARVSTLPLSDYLKYETDFWKRFSSKHGEQISFIDKEKFEKIKSDAGFELKDFWMFDDKLVIIFHYNENGNFLDEELITDPAAISKHVELKTKLLGNSIGMIQFLYKAKHFGEV